MVQEDSDPADHNKKNRRRKGKKRTSTQIKKRPAHRKNGSLPLVYGLKDLTKEVKCTYPAWKKYLKRYPMIDSIQREDFPDHGVSFVYVMHFYRTKNEMEENNLAQQEVEDFFKEIGYEYDYSGNFESRWFEGIGVKIS